MASNISNPNFLSQFGFKTLIKRIPHLEYFSQTIEIPGLQQNVVFQPTPFTPIPYSSTVQYSPLVIRFKVDENLENWRAIYDWMRKSGNAKDYTGYKELSEADSGFGLTSDITLSILKSSMIGNKSFTFKDAFPVQLGDLSFNSIGTDVNYIESSVSFQYTYYDIG